MFRSTLALAALTFSSLLTSRASASTVVIWPVDPTIAAKQQATALWLENKGATPVTLQVRTLGWSQASGGDALATQDEVIASPPIAEVAPGQRQLVRLIRRAPAPADGEHSYRLLIDELPAPPAAVGDARASAQLSVQMRYSIPLFTYGEPSEAGAAHLSMRLRTDGATRTLEIANTGTRHARLTDLKLGVGTQAVMVRAGLAGYVLAGATLRLPLPAGVNGTAVSVGVNGVEQTLLPAA